MNGSLEMKRSFFPRRYSIAYENNVQLAANLLPTFAEFCLKHVLPPEALEERPVKNLKGVDVVSLPPLPGEHPAPGKEELALLAGHFFSAPGERGDSFSLTLSTSFLEFPTPSEITHAVQQIRSLTIPGSFRALTLARAIPAEITLFRMGLESFEARSGGVFSGVNPVVTTSIRVLCQRERVRVSVTRDEFRNLDELPFGSGGPFDRVSEILSRLSGVDLRDDYFRKLRT